MLHVRWRRDDEAFSCRVSALHRAVCLLMQFTHSASPFEPPDFTCACFFFPSSLHMAHVSFARSHLYFDSLHRMTHFFCLTHSAVRILISNSYKAPGSLSALKKYKKKKKDEGKKIENEKAGRTNKWDCYISCKLEQKFRPPPSQQRGEKKPSLGPPR